MDTGRRTFIDYLGELASVFNEMVIQHQRVFPFLELLVREDICYIETIKSGLILEIHENGVGIFNQ